MKLKRVILLIAVILLVLPLWTLAQPPYRVAVLPFTVHSAEDLSYLRDGIWDIISTRVIVEGEITVVERPLIERFLSDLRGAKVTDREARWLGTRVGADYLVYGSITKIGDYISLDAKVVNVSGTRPTTSCFVQHKGMDEVMVKVGTFAQDISNRILGRSASYERRGPGQLRHHLMFQALGYTKLQGFPQRILKGVDAGDVDGDGKNEIVVIDHHQIWLYRDEGKGIRLLAEFKETSNNTFLTLDVADINEDKKAEIIVTNVIEDDLQSFILAYDEGAFKYLAKGLNWYLRVKKVPGKGQVLLAQRMGTDKDYEGPVRLVKWKKKRFKKGKKVKLPKQIEWIYSFTAGKFTSPEAQEFLVVDEFGNVRMLDEKGATQWKSGEDLGGSDNYIDRPNVFAGKRGAPDVFARRIYLPPRMIAKDLDGDGIDDVVAVVNKFTAGKHVERVRIYDKGYVTGLTWDGMSLAKAWRTQDIPGYVADFQIKDVDNDGKDELVTVSVSSHFLRKDAKGLLMVYELYE
ncbi:MAG: VCBS repeat-containing protein [Deltaproteobacteria bacterium]|nr:VCBS repeat-containing protein [Deltaproteobacteria bacterium]